MKKNPSNQKSQNLDMISQRNHQMNMRESFENENHKTHEIKNEIDSYYDSKMNVNLYEYRLR